MNSAEFALGEIHNSSWLFCTRKGNPYVHDDGSGSGQRCSGRWSHFANGCWVLAAPETLIYTGDAWNWPKVPCAPQQESAAAFASGGGCGMSPEENHRVVVGAGTTHRVCASNLRKHASSVGSAVSRAAPNAVSGRQ